MKSASFLYSWLRFFLIKIWPKVELKYLNYRYFVKFYQMHTQISYIAKKKKRNVCQNHAKLRIQIKKRMVCST